MNNSNSNHISIYQKNERIKIKFEDIIYVEAAGCYSIFYTKNDKSYVSCHKLKHYEELMSESSFFRINRSYLINKEYIQYYHIDTRELILSNTLILFVSFRKQKSFVSSINENGPELKYDRFIKKLNIPNLTIKN